jgi:hypothetical protein
MVKQVIVNNNENAIPVEVLAESIVKMSAAAQKLNSSGLTRRALVILIADIVPCNVRKHDIVAVLDALPKLADTYVKKAV